ncbi:hypothetical protein PInf_025479 [Phytophthora infestans]|nr:hypothetical protein PInf_025479 [Phytophthora infestans]
MDASVIASFREKVVQKPEVFFTPSEEVAKEIKAFAKHAYDRTSKYQSKSGGAAPLEELYVDGFDADQVWEQLRLLNGPLVTEMTQRIRTFDKNPDNILLFPSEKQEKSEEEEEQEELEEEREGSDADGDEKDSDDDENSDDDTADSDEEETAAKKSKKKKVKKARDVAEDGFFDWDEMDKAAEEEEEDDDEDMDGDEDENDENDEEDDDESEMEEDSDAETAEEMKYDDFFDEEEEGGEEGDEEEEELNDVDMQEGDHDEEEYPTINRSKPDEEENVDDEELAERGIMSSHQRQRHRLQKEIKDLEQEAISEKPWLLKGEVRSAARPENSLLEAVLDYDRPVKAAPVITEEVSIALEEMIKKRILEDDYDDVIRKFAGNEEDKKNKLEEKSKEGLGEIYEKEYMKTAMGFEADDESKQDQEEIEVMFKSLCWKLDALSNYHFTPKPAVKELHVKPAVPAIAMEEVVPISVSDANLKAPEEVYEKKRKRGEAVLQSKEEMTQTERKALRNAKKHARRKENRQREFDERLVAKLNPGLGNNIAGAKNITTGKQIEGSSKQFSNSKEFFTRLQDEVQEKIRNASSK